MSDAEINWKELATTRSWFEAVIEGEATRASGLIENVQLEGGYVSLLENHFLPEDQVWVDICVRDLDRGRHLVLTVRARVVKADKKGVCLRFLPMVLSDHFTLREIVHRAPIYRGRDRSQNEGVLHKERPDYSYSYE